MPNQNQEEHSRRADEEVRRELPPGLKLLRTLQGGKFMTHRIAWSPIDNRIAAASSTGWVTIWNTEEPRPLTSLHEKLAVYAVAFSPDASLLAYSGLDRLIHLWKSEKGQEVADLAGHEAAIWGIAFAPDGSSLASASDDGTLRLWDWKNPLKPSRILAERLGAQFWHVAFSRDGWLLAGCATDLAICVWDCDRQEQRFALRDHDSPALTVEFSPARRWLAAACHDGRIPIWDLETGRLVTSLEGHTAGVDGVSFSADGALLASKATDGTVRIWRLDDFDTVATIDECREGEWVAAVGFHSQHPLLATLDRSNTEIRLWEVDSSVLLRRGRSKRITFTSAKVVLVGESKVGKSYLAHRIATGEPPKEGTIQTTHGMKFWPLDPEQLSPAAKAPADQRREVVLWDMGGQEEYRLIHQLFLHDTTVAFLLFDPTRGAGELKEVETWNRYLEKQLRGRAAVKLLVGAKLDEPNNTIDRKGLERLVKDYGFVGYYETSAISGRGLPEFCEAVAKAIDWDGLAKTSRPELFQRIRDEIEARRKRGEVVLTVSALERTLVDQDPELQGIVDAAVGMLVSQGVVHESSGNLRLLKRTPGTLAWTPATGRTVEIIQMASDEVDARFVKGDVQLTFVDLCRSIISRDVAAVAEQLATQGVIARSRFSTGQPVLVLQVQEIERYAGSLILAARNNPRGVPALDLRAIAHEGFPLPGIAEEERLPRVQEKVVVECTVQLMLEYGICFQHEGLLIFPSLFASSTEAPDTTLPHAVSLYYDFAGAIDNIYASLVAWLVLARDFGRVRLWSDRVEFEVKDGGLCGLRKVGRAGGFAHVDVYFEGDTPELQRREFISFVEDHLARNGMEIHEHVAIKCACGHEFAEETLRQRIARGDKDVVCPICEARHSLAEGAEEAREGDPKIAQHTWALRTQIEKQREKITKQVVHVLAKAEETEPTAGPFRLLHLSDLHFTKGTPIRARLQWLLDDLKQDAGLGFKELDYLVISGDFTNKGCAEGFEAAYEFVSGLTQEFGLSAERCIFVPGNHDVRDLREAYDWRDKPDDLKEGEWVKQGDIILARNAQKYPLRFKPFSELFFHKFVQRPYPLDWAAQGMAIPFWDTGFQFLALNSCWQIDQFHRERAGVHPEAVANAINQAQKQEGDARKTGQLAAGKLLLQIAVWHHAVAGQEQIKDTDFLGNLQKNGVRLALHGDVHEGRRDLIGYWHEKKLHVVGSGSFGARAEDRPESMPRLYNVLEIARDLKSVRVHTRCQPKPDGPWDGWYEWRDPDGGKGRVPYYDIKWA